MKKVILEEIENMKYLLRYKRGVVISEQEETNDLIDKYSSKSISNSINSGNFANLNPAAADAIKQAQNMVGGKPLLPNATTVAPTTAAPTTAASTPVTPIKTGVKYPDIEKLQISLNTKNQAGLNPDGKYGPKTAASILAALQKLPVNSTETKTLGTNNTNQSAETLKKTAEANASTNGVVNNDQNKNTQQPAGGTNVPEEDGNEFV